MSPRTPQPVPTLYGVRLRRARIRLGLNPNQVAERTGVARTTVVHVEDGRDAALSTVLAFAGAVDLPVHVLFRAPECWQCDGSPPAGFICSECDRHGGSVHPDRDNHRGDR